MTTAEERERELEEIAAAIRAAFKALDRHVEHAATGQNT